MKKVFSKIFMLSVGALAFTACADEYNPGAVTKEDLLKENYAKHWEDVFGTPDPNQDWSMAQPVVATLSVGSNATAEIYSDVPVYATSKLLGLVNGKTSTFNIVKGTNQVFALVKENGKTIAQGYYNVIDGKINIDNSPVTRVTLDNVWNMLATRAASDVTKGASHTIITNAETTVKKYQWKTTPSSSDVAYYTLEELRAFGETYKSSFSLTNYAPFNSDCVVPAGIDWSNPQIDPTKVNAVADKDGYWCNLNNVWGVYTLDEIITEKKKVTQNIGYGLLPLLWSAMVPEGTQQYQVTSDNIDWSKAEVDMTQQGVYSVSNGDVIWWPTGSSTYQKNTLEELIDIVKARGTTDYTPLLESSIVSPAHLDFTNATINTTSAPLVFPPTQSITLTYLNGVEKWAAEPWTLELGKQLFGPKTFFQEQRYYWGAGGKDFDKTTLYGTTPEEVIATMNKIESGFSIETSGGEIEVPFIYGATQNQDQFGYVYYKEGQDPLTQPHYVLMNDGRPDYNLYFDTWDTGKTSNSVGNMQLAGWTEEGAANALSTGQTPDQKVYGTKYKLAFFGENHDQTATYDFDPGYKIVFFICVGTGIKSDGTMDTYATNNYHYSIPELNKRIHHYYTNTLSPTWNPEEKGASDLNRGAVKAVAWETQGMTFMGFEDGGGDEDLNDIVFWVSGAFTPEQDLVDVPVETGEGENSWILACEDLGGTFDYDFNDVVLEVAQKYETTKTGDDDPVKTYGDVEIRLLAAGGTLPANVVYGSDESDEIHELIGQTKDQNIYSADVTPHKVVLFTINTDTQVNLADLCNSIKIKVNRADGTVYVTTPSANTPYNKEGDATPQIIVLPGEWEWPTEGTPINEAYPEFTNWANDATWTDWSANKASGKTVSR